MELTSVAAAPATATAAPAAVTVEVDAPEKPEAAQSADQAAPQRKKPTNVEKTEAVCGGVFGTLAILCLVAGIMALSVPFTMDDVEGLA